MATIDLIVLGMLKKESLSAYDIQKLVEYRNISKWVKISTPSIYKKVITHSQPPFCCIHASLLFIMNSSTKLESCLYTPTSPAICSCGSFFKENSCKGKYSYNSSAVNDAIFKYFFHHLAEYYSGSIYGFHMKVIQERLPLLFNFFLNGESDSL